MQYNFTHYIDTEVKYLKLHTKIVNDYINTQTTFVTTLCIPISLKGNSSMNK